jgi:hypothetical protein
MRLMAAEGRRRGLPVEQLLVLLKREWRALDGPHYVDWGSDREYYRAERRSELLPRLVSTLIEEFYRG